MTPGNLIKELKRRNLHKAVLSYLAVAWLLLQAGSILFPLFDLEIGYQKGLVTLLIILFPLWLVFAWFYDITSEGVIRTQDDTQPDVQSNKRANVIIIGLLSAAVVLLIADRVLGLSKNLNVKSLRSIAVLPFDNLSGDENQEFYAGGMQDELIGHLAKLGKLRVISRTSTLKYQSDRLSMAQIADELNVDLIVEGSLMKYGDSVRIQVQLIEANENENHLWNQMYTKPIKNVLNMHSEVTRDIAKSIRLTLSPSEQDQLTQREVNPEAYEAVLRGRFHIYQFTPQDIQLGLQYFQKAITIDSTYANAYAGISFAGGFLLVSGALPPVVAGEMMVKNAYKSLQLDPDLSAAHVAVAAAETWSTWNWEKADKSWIRALELDPNDPNSQVYYGHFLACMGRSEEAVKHGQKTIELDPHNPFFRGLYAVILMMAGDDEGAEEQCNLALEMDPNNPFPLYPKMGLAVKNGENETAYRLFKSYLNMMGGQPIAIAMENGYQSGGVEGAMLAGASVLKEVRKQIYIRPHMFTIIYEIAGDTEQALDWLDSSYVYKDHDMVYAGNGTYSEAMRSDPRFKEIIARMKFPDK